jgi:glycosyltransferase 2 family protein
MVQKVIMVLSLVLYIFFCFALIPFTLPGIPTKLALASGIGALLLGAGGICFGLLQRRGPCALLLRTLKRLGLCPALLIEKEPDLLALDAQLASFSREHAARGYLSLALYFLGWMLHALEVYVIFWLLGHPVRLDLALCFDALSQLIAGLGFIIPASLGVQDGGNILISLGFQLGATLGAAFSIYRRLREAFWLCLGLVVVARER